jgi:hypothetical protein
MNPLRRAVTSVLRLAGAGLTGLGVVLLALAWVARHKQPMSAGAVALYAALVLGGVLLILRAPPVAARLTRDFED